MVPAVDHMMSPALAEESAYEETFEDFPASPPETAIRERNKSEQERPSIGFESLGKTKYNKLDFDEKEALLPRWLARPVSPRIHVLGTSNLGKFIAHALAGIGDPPPVTLLSNRKDVLNRWDGEGKFLEVIKGKTSCPCSGIDVGHTALEGQADSGERIIDKLIVTTKAHATVPALLAIKRRLLASSTVCFFQNGMGILDEVNAIVFPNPATRPRYIVGMTSHSLGSQQGRIFTTVYNKPGNIYLSLVPGDAGTRYTEDRSIEQQTDQKFLVKRMSYGWTVSSRELMRSLTRCPILKAKGFQYDEMFSMQIERLAVNAILSPLSVVFDCSYEKLLENSAIAKLMRQLLKEIVEVAQSLPELCSASGVKDKFKVKKLEYLIVERASKDTNHRSGMLQDVRKGKKTDIDFINGYIVKRGLELGIPCPVNNAIIQMVKAKQSMNKRREESYIPFHDR